MDEFNQLNEEQKEMIGAIRDSYNYNQAIYSFAMDITSLVQTFHIVESNNNNGEMNPKALMRSNIIQAINNKATEILDKAIFTNTLLKKFPVHNDLNANNEENINNA